jgi:FtsH-binding integral membrane protein
MRNLKQQINNLQYYKLKFFSFFFLLCGFIFGNLIGIYSKKICYNETTLVLFNIVLEMLNFLCYSLLHLTNKNNINKIKNLINIIKRGLLLGIFVEAFKLGS